jgi:hypothetical protein
MHHRFLGSSVEYITFTFVPFRWLYVAAAKQRRQFVRLFLKLFPQLPIHSVIPLCMPVIHTSEPQIAVEIDIVARMQFVSIAKMVQVFNKSAVRRRLVELFRRHMALDRLACRVVVDRKQIEDRYGSVAGPSGEIGKTAADEA